MGLYLSTGCFLRVSSSSSSSQPLLCILGVRLHMYSWLWLGSAFVCFLVFPLPPLPIQGSRGLSSIVFSIELTVQCDGCLIWCLGWQAGLMTGLWVGEAYGVFHQPGFGLLVSVPRSLSIQPPFATQALKGWYCRNFHVKWKHRLYQLGSSLCLVRFTCQSGWSLWFGCTHLICNKLNHFLVNVFQSLIHTWIFSSSIIF